MPVGQHVNTSFGDRGFNQSHPAATFVKKYRVFRAKGYEDEKAFDMVIEEMTEIFETQKDEMRVLRGSALAQHGDSYLDRAQKISELESQLKLQRFARDIPKFERSQDQSWLDGEGDENAVERDSIESLFGLTGTNKGKDIDIDYNPVLY